MSKEIIKVLEHLGEKFGIAIDWTAENIMPYVTELFKRFATLKIVYASIGIFIGLITVVITIILTIKVIKSFIKAKKEKSCTTLWNVYYDDTMDPSGMGVIVIIAIFICVITALSTLILNIPSLIEWIIIPEVPLVKEIMNIINTGTITV